MNAPVMAELLKVLHGERRVFDGEAGYCLRVAREVVAPPLGFDPGDALGFHELFSHSRVEGNETGAAWARSCQRTLRDELGLEVPFADRQGGDLLFIAELGAPIGHVLTLVTPDVALESTGSERGIPVLDYRYLRLTPVAELPLVHKAEVMRLAPLVRG